MLACQQTAGFTKGGRTSGYRNLEFGRIIEVEVLEDQFQVADDFNPRDSQYAEWVFHLEGV